MLAISRAFRPNEPRWLQVSVAAVMRAVPVGDQVPPASVNPGTTIWTPPFPCYIRGFTINVDGSDPLVPAGGATTLSIGVRDATAAAIGAESTLVRALPIAGVWNGGTNPHLLGWGVDGGGVATATGIGISDSGIVLAPAGSVPGQAAYARTIAAITNAGTATGTLRMRFEMRPFAGPW